MHFGNWVDSELAKHDKKGKPLRTIHQILGTPVQGHQLTRKEVEMMFGVVE